MSSIHLCLTPEMAWHWQMPPPPSHPLFFPLPLPLSLFHFRFCCTTLDWIPHLLLYRLPLPLPFHNPAMSPETDGEGSTFLPVGVLISNPYVVKQFDYLTQIHILSLKAIAETDLENQKNDHCDIIQAPLLQPVSKGECLCCTTSQVTSLLVWAPVLCGLYNLQKKEKKKSCFCVVWGRAQCMIIACAHVGKCPNLVNQHRETSLVVPWQRS